MYLKSQISPPKSNDVFIDSEKCFKIKNDFTCRILAHCQWGSQPDPHLPNWQKYVFTVSKDAWLRLFSYLIAYKHTDISGFIVRLKLSKTSCLSSLSEAACLRPIVRGCLAPSSMSEAAWLYPKCPRLPGSVFSIQGCLAPSPMSKAAWLCLQNK